ncbi:unnamed protein product [Vitrella brassicaformis CCMP3155]|uniref:Alpha-galactosidase n=1 Tax=Vitrella brassicaformis (strain CCMP3155) TaxID=1169540 RepID=A0A0G4ECQ8_VITBC|nr:unnamed protein product [Vitrella brassicaformis CCMP3155]|eukprot:CEL93329.1 unnamed protein product [Vitrella brassicaformis CCMP3155]
MDWAVLLICVATLWQQAASVPLAALLPIGAPVTSKDITPPPPRSTPAADDDNDADTGTAASPPYVFTVFVSENGDDVESPSPGRNQLMYKVTDRATGGEIVESSALGVTVNGMNLGRGVEMHELPPEEMEETYVTLGKHRLVTSHAMDYTFPVRQMEGNITWYLNVRLFNDGAAFRYSWDGTDKDQISDEDTEFVMPDGSHVWHFERTDGLSVYELWSYAGEWFHSPVDHLATRNKDFGHVYGPPLLFEMDPSSDGWSGKGIQYVMVTEAALYDFSGMRIEAFPGRIFRANFSEAIFAASPKSEDDGLTHTPWRVVMLAANLDELVNNEMVSHLNPAPDPELFQTSGSSSGWGDQMAVMGPQQNDAKQAVGGELPSWVLPGRSVWAWYNAEWTEDRGWDETTVEGEKRYIEAAAELGFEYTTVDCCWQQWGNNDTTDGFLIPPIRRRDPNGLWPEALPEMRTAYSMLADLSDYARERGVKVIAWKDTNDNDTIVDPGPTGEFKSLRRFLNRLKATGASGVKVDFVHGETEDLVRFETALMEMSAELELVVNLHGCHKPSGESRRYPNQLTREAVWGMEIMRLIHGADFILDQQHLKPITARHNAILPFTRFVLGGADYTPMALNAERRGNTTLVHQMALLVLFDSPLQTIAEDPHYLLDKSKPHAPALDVIKAIPTTWHTTHTLPPSRIGQLAVMARKTNNDTTERWFLAAINGREETVVVPHIPVEFLDESKTYEMVSISSGDDADAAAGGVVQRREGRGKGVEWAGRGLEGVRLLKGDGLVVMWTEVKVEGGEGEEGSRRGDIQRGEL